MTGSCFGELPKLPDKPQPMTGPTAAATATYQELHALSLAIPQWVATAYAIDHGPGPAEWRQLAAKLDRVSAMCLARAADAEAIPGETEQP